MIRSTTFGETLQLGVGFMVICDRCGRAIDHLADGHWEHTAWGNGELYATPDSQLCWECKGRSLPAQNCKSAKSDVQVQEKRSGENGEI